MKPDKVLTIKQLLERGQYRVDPYAIADAIIRWAGLTHEVPPPPASQKEWSKPANGPSAPKKLSSAAPAKTDPIQVRPAFAAGEL
jgi:Anti-sigma-28 factor, FlgM